MRNDMTELVFILDRSGSMHGMESDTIGGFNRVIDEQKKQPGEALVTTILFDDTIQMIHDRIPLSLIRPMTEKDYQVGGCTALLDAIGTGIDKLVNVMRQMRDEGAGHVQFVIITDGMENASRKYDRGMIRQRITLQQKKYNWDFLFLGANMDAITVAQEMGIHEDRAVETICDTDGARLQYDAISCAISERRAAKDPCAPGTSAWKQQIEKDTAARKRK